MKAIFIQLSRQDPIPEISSENIAFIPGRIIATALEDGLCQKDDWQILDDNTAEHGSDAAVRKKIIEASCDLIVFVLFPWNIERSVWIAKKLRQSLKASFFVACGPDALFGNENSTVFDAVIEGNPEFVFSELVNDVNARTVLPRYSQKAPNGAADPARGHARGYATDPWLSGVLPVKTNKAVLFDGIGMDSVQMMENASKLIAHASMMGAVEFRFLGNLLDGVDNRFLKSIAAANEGGLEIRAKLNLALLDNVKADLLLDAGLSFTDSELLSVNPLALNTIGRKLNRAAYEAGLGNLWAREIAVRPLILVGLPFDNYDSIVETFDFLAMSGAGQDSILRPLSIRPGTAFQKNASENGILGWLNIAPYWVQETSWLNEDDIFQVLADYEESFDVALTRPLPPRFAPSRGGYISFIDARKNPEQYRFSAQNMANSICIFIDADNSESLDKLLNLSKALVKENPFTLWQIVLHSDNTIPDERLVSRLFRAFSFPDHYYELCQYYSLDPQSGFQTRMFYSTRSEALALFSMQNRSDIEPLFILGDKLPNTQLLDTMPFIGYDRDRLPLELVYDIVNAYRDYPDMLVEIPGNLLS